MVTEYDYPKGDYMGSCITCKADYFGLKRSLVCYKCSQKKPDYEAIRQSKRIAMSFFKAAYDKAKAEGTITYKKL